MKKRREFLKMASLTGISTSFAKPLETLQGFINEDKGNSYPLVIATWKNEMAVKTAWDVLAKTGNSLNAVEAGARIPEADPNDTSVGYGGFPDRDGKVTLDACIMDSEGNAGGVMFIEGIKHPISVARLVMEQTPHVFLAGAGAKAFALEKGFQEENLLTPTAKKAWEEWKVKAQYKPKINFESHDTIGILSQDSEGNLAGACSTSGLAFKMNGRVGDSPIIGAGLYVDNEVGAATATGLGEAVIKKVGAFSIVEMMRMGKTPQKACEEAIGRLLKLKNATDMQVGYIAVNKYGEIGAFSLQPGFQYSIVIKGKYKVVNSESHFKNK